MLRFASSFLFFVVLAGCRPTVDAHCSDSDRAAARTIAYDATGAPAYAGQALMLRSCAGGGSFCHVEGAADRYGAPFDLDLDPVLADDPRFAQESDGAAHLLAAQLRIEHFRDDIYATVVGGSMPPGQVGRDTEPAAYVVYAGPDDVTGTPLPDVSSPEGADLLRAWLACGVPVIEATAAQPSRPCTSSAQCAPLALCDTSVSLCVPVGDVAVRRAPMTSPTFSSIYATILAPTCASDACHGAAGAASAGALDLSSADVAYAALVGIPASASECGVRVASGSPDGSFLVAKLEGTESTACGDPMPLTGMLDASQIAAVRAWITAGAAND